MEEGVHQSWQTHLSLAFVCLSLLSLHSHTVFQNQAEQDITLPEALLADKGAPWRYGLSALTQTIPFWTLEMSDLHPLLEVICALCVLGNSDRRICPSGEVFLLQER